MESEVLAEPGAGRMFEHYGYVMRKTSEGEEKENRGRMKEQYISHV